jgi:hypothetical protein
VGARVLTPRLGEVPTTAERLLVVERLLAEALARIEVLEAARDADDAVDGPAPQALPPNWVSIKVAAAFVGRSESALLKAIKRHPDGVRWWRYDRGRLFADIDRLPWPQVRTRT